MHLKRSLDQYQSKLTIVNLSHKYKLNPGFHRIGDRYGHLIEDRRLMGRNPFDELKLTKKQVPVNILSTDKYYELELPVPGYVKEDISIDIDDHILTVKGERSRDKDRPDTTYITCEHNLDSFERSFELDKYVDEEKIDAHAENGLLVIRLYRINVASTHPVSHIEIK